MNPLYAEIDRLKEVNKELLEACKASLEREYLEIELSSIRARERDRNRQTSESILLDRKNKEKITDRLREIDKAIRAAIAKAGGKP